MNTLERILANGDGRSELVVLPGLMHKFTASLRIDTKEGITSVRNAHGESINEALCALDLALREKEKKA